MAEPSPAPRPRGRFLLILAAIGATLAGAASLLPMLLPHENGADLPRLAEVVVRVGDAATRGALPDFTALRAAAEQLDQQAAALPGRPIAEAWAQARPSVTTLLDSEAEARAAQGAAATLLDALHGRGAGSADHGLVAAYQTLAEAGAAAGAGTEMGAGPALLAASQVATLERIAAIAARLGGNGLQAEQVAAALGPLLEKAQANHEALAADAALLPAEQAAPLKARLDALAQDVSRLQTAAPALEKLMLAAAQLGLSPPGLVPAALRSTAPAGPLTAWAALGGSAIALLALASYALLRRRQPESAAPAASATPDQARQQQAILRLLDEITNLANGDLTVDVTVTEDFTGAIADSINYTVQTLRGLVGTINETSGRITASAVATREIAAALSEASDAQARQVSSAAETIAASAQSLLDVAARAERMAVEARNSVQVANRGAATVGQTIQNMAALREQIQDTAKRIKRLGESSQLVGSITEVIDDLAEQTNTLALNASIQANNAGGHSRGFEPIARQIQELAERAADEARQIETLVKTIQADTGEAVISMERSTAHVVAGATSAEEAGQALTRIEASSQELSASVEAIAGSARGQSAEAVKLAGTMQSLRAIAGETSASADRTAQAVAELNALADRLRESVAGFKLPGAAPARTVEAE